MDVVLAAAARCSPFLERLAEYGSPHGVLEAPA
jgi:hypothetical protein